MAKVTDMTVGNPTKLLAAFALPMLLGNLFQQLYSMVDTLIVIKTVPNSFPPRLLIQL